MYVQLCLIISQFFPDLPEYQVSAESLAKLHCATREVTEVDTTLSTGGLSCQYLGGAVTHLTAVLMM